MRSAGNVARASSSPTTGSLSPVTPSASIPSARRRTTLSSFAASAAAIASSGSDTQKARRESLRAGVTTLISASSRFWPTTSASCSGSTGSAAITRSRMCARYPAGARGKRSVAMARVALAGPGREQEQQPGVARHPHLVALGRVVYGERAGAGALGAAVLHQLDLAVDDHQPRALVNLVLAQRLAGRELDDDRSTLALGLEHLGLVRFDRERAEVPVLHRGHPTLATHATKLPSPGPLL